MSNELLEEAMFDLSDPRSWTYFTNWVLVVVAFIAAGFIGYGVLREKRARQAIRGHSVNDAHTLVLPDLGITMADGGEKVTEKKPANPKTPA
jgi:hypothetical protein